MSWAAVATIAAPVVGGLIGADQAKGARNDAENARANALAQFLGITVPTVESMQVDPEQFTNAGQLTPEMIELISQGPTAMEQVNVDPRLRDSQMQSLAGLEELSNRGMSSADQAAFELARRNSAAEAQAKQNQILQNMQQRGQAGSGAELAASMINAQSSADRQQQAQLEEAKARQAARMAALQQQASVAANVRGADYGEQSALANARDTINRFNATNAQQVGAQNTGARNNAQATNLNNAQNIRNSNTQLNNQAQQTNKNLIQNNFNNQMSLAGAKAAQYGTAAQAADTRAGQTAGMWSGVGQGIGTIAAGYLNKDKKPGEA